MFDEFLTKVMGSQVSHVDIVMTDFLRFQTLLDVISNAKIMCSYTSQLYTGDVKGKLLPDGKSCVEIAIRRRPKVKRNDDFSIIAYTLSFLKTLQD